MKPIQRRIRAAVAAAAAIAASGWAGAQAVLPYQPSYRVTGTIKVSGSPLGRPSAMEALEQGFIKFHPDVQFSNDFPPNSEGAIAGLYYRGSDIAPAGDDAKVSDMMTFTFAYHYAPLEVTIATGGYEARGSLWPAVFIVNKDNPIAHLSMRQVDGIFGSERTGGWEINYGRPGDILFTAKYARGAEADIRKWGQLGLTGEWADKPIQTYGYAAPGFTAYFERRVLHWSDKWNPNYREYVEPKQAPEGGEGEAVFSVRPLEALTRDPYGIAWGAHFHAKEFPGLKELAIGSSDDGPFVPPTPETVRDRTYPLVRNVYVYLNRDPVRPMDPRVREFLRFVLSREGQAIIEKGGFYSPLTAAALQENLGKLE